MRYKTKGIIKKIGLVLLGLGVLGGSVVGITHLVNYMKQDKESIHPTFEVGGLNAQGRYEEDKSSLYTKDKFACDGLQATLEFDAQINYQVFYYDILDNFISSTEVLTDGYGEEAPLNGAYARIEITPTNDEDCKISFTEKLKYANMLNLKVKKGAESNVSKKFVSYRGKNLTVIDSTDRLNFEVGVFMNENGDWTTNGNNYAATSKVLLAVGNYTNLSCKASSEVTCGYSVGVYKFTDLQMGRFTKEELVEGYSFDVSKCEYVLITLYLSDATFDNVSIDDFAFTLSK